MTEDVEINDAATSTGTVGEAVATVPAEDFPTEGFPAGAVDAEEDEHEDEDPPDPVKLMRGGRAAAVLLVSVILGIAGDILFYSENPQFGVNAFLFTAVFLAMLAYLLPRFKVQIVPHHAAFAIPALIFAGLVSVRSAAELTFLNLGVMVTAVFIVIEYVSVKPFLGGGVLNLIRRAMGFGLVGWVESSIILPAESVPWFRNVKFDSKRSATTAAIVRGVLLTIPLVIIFGGLLTSADAVFGEALGEVLGWFVPENPTEIINHTFVIGVFAWLGVICFYPVWLASVEKSETEEKTEAAKKAPFFRLSLIESGMMLGTVDAMFAVFIAIQARYLFGGEANITAQGYTYAEYARRGFYELVAVSVLTVALILLLDAITHRKREREYLFQGFASVMVVLTALLLVAAYYRLSLYEAAYGFTRIRVMSMVFMVWVGLLLAVLLTDILVKKRRIFWMGAAVAAMGFVLTLNVMNMDAYIVRQNIDREDAVVELDVYYLLSLSDDAIPVLVTLLDEDSVLNESQRETLSTSLACDMQRLEVDRMRRNLWSYHFGQERAYQALDARRDDLTWSPRCWY